MSHLKLILALIISLSVSGIAAAATDTGVLFVSAKGNGRCGSGPFINIGYNSFLMSGSYSPTGLAGGELVAALFDGIGPFCFSLSGVTISGFSSNPGQNWLASVTCGTVSKPGSSAAFSYASGTAFWEWSSLFGLSSHVNSNVSCTIAHT